MSFDLTHKGEWCYRSTGNAHLVESSTADVYRTKCGRDLRLETLAGRLMVSNRVPWGVDVCMRCAEGINDARPEATTGREGSRRRHRRDGRRR